jgi:hypothetical protein
MTTEQKLLLEIFIVKTHGLYYKHITIVNDASRVIRMMIVSDATT